ncbi:MAG TPA: hypothetical protein VG892_02410 [Terriglobales bacterium]|nr:hypothetical protein [Terriglobales bacterium]
MQGTGRADDTLKITTIEKPEATVIKLEGRLAGPWVAELEKAIATNQSLKEKKPLWVDIRELTFVDPTGRVLLGEIHQNAHARFLANSPLTRYFAEEAMRPAGKDGFRTDLIKVTQEGA